MVIDAAAVSITDEQAALIECWLTANAKAPGWLDGYALGASYIDTRVKGGSKTDGRQAYVKLDHDTARRVPQLRGFHARDVSTYLAARVAAGGMPK